MFCDYFTMASCAKVSFELMNTNGLEEKAENEKFMAAGSPCQNLKFQVVVKYALHMWYDDIFSLIINNNNNNNNNNNLLHL